MGSEVRTIELTVVSAIGLKKVTKFGSAQQRCYAVAYIYGAQRQATHADRAGGVNPTWNAPLSLTCYETDLFPDSNASYATSSSSSSSRAITIDIYSHLSGLFSSGDKMVGTVLVPLHHIASAAQGENLTMMACDVHRPTSGKVQGKLNLNVKLGQKQTIGDPAAHQQLMPSYAYHRSQVETSSMNRPIVTSHNTASSAPSALGIYDPNSDTYAKQEFVTGYPVTGYGFAPLGSLAGRPQPITQGQNIFETPQMTKRQRRRARKAQRAADPQWQARKARRRKRLTTAAMIVGGIVLAALLI